MSSTVVDRDLIRAAKIRRKDGVLDSQLAKDDVVQEICTIGDKIEDMQHATTSIHVPNKNTVKKQAFRAKGYCVVRKFFSPEQILAMKTASEDQIPVQTLRAQYNQPGDDKRYEYLFKPPVCCRTSVSFLSLGILLFAPALTYFGVAFARSNKDMHFDVVGGGVALL